MCVHFCCALPHTRAFAMRCEHMAIAGRMRARERRHGPHAAQQASEGGSDARERRAWLASDARKPACESLRVK